MNLSLDDSLIEEAVRVGNHGTNEEAVTAALLEYVQARRRREILELVGRVDYYDDYDPKRLRGRQGVPGISPKAETRSVAEAFEEARRICAEEDYELEIPPREDLT